MSLALHHLAIVVRDLDRAEAFYAGLLGLPVDRRWPDGAGQPRSVWLSLAPGFLALERAEAAGPTRSPRAPGLHCLALGIPPGERQAWRTRLERGGYPVVRETPFTLYVEDPDGNLVGLSHYPSPAPQA